MLKRGLRPLAEVRTQRFEGKVSAPVALCRGGEAALAARNTPWVDWSHYWATGDASSKSGKRDDTRLPIPPLLRHLVDRNKRGIDGALMDLEYQRMELIRFNLFDNSTWQDYVTGRRVNGGKVAGPLLKVWKEMRLPPDDPNFNNIRVLPNGDQQCKGPLVRFRTLTGICNDIRNPAMGSTGQPFGRNVQFESTYPALGLDRLARN